MALDESYWSQSVVVEDSRGAEFCYIPEVTFAYGYEQQPAEIQAPLYIARHPVTKAEFHEFFVAGGCDIDPDLLMMMDALAPAPDCPATPVSWDDAKAYVRWLRNETGEYYSLPFEWEWEFAARGPSGFPYPWGHGDVCPDLACYSTDLPRRQTVPVNSHPSAASSLGCLNMVGNVWEWCLDSFDDDNQTHVLRGGSCADSFDACHCCSRRYVYPSCHRMQYAGFRITYLPGDMFLAYRMAMMGEAATVEGTIVEG